MILRIDKFLNAVNITKRRTIAQDMLQSGVVFVNTIKAKPAKKIQVGDVIELVYLNRTDKYEILDIPTLKSTPKSDKNLYVKELS